MYNIVIGLETFLTLAIDAESELRPPKPLRHCHHGIPSNLCQHTKDDMKYRCPTSEDIKYRMTRVAIDVIDLYLIESGTALHTWVIIFIFNFHFFFSILFSLSVQISLRDISFYILFLFLQITFLFL